jgi:hypothetical protein
MEQEPNLDLVEAHISQGLRQRFLNSPAARRITAAVAAVGLMSGAGETALSTETVSADSLPAAAGLTLEQQCEDVALARPTVINKPVMSNAGIRLGQITRATFLFAALPDNCAPQYIRTAAGYLQIHKHGKWIQTSRNPDTGAIGNQEQRNRFLDQAPHPTPSFPFDECVHGRFQKARVVLRNFLKTGENRHRIILAKKSYILPVEVNGRCKAAVRSRRHYKNLAQ